VNEFLQQLERFPGVVACTTNLFSELDPAVLRRFTFKVEFGYLGPEQAMTLFEDLVSSLGGGALDAATTAWVQESLRSFARLAPGDFSAVARRTLLLAGGYQPEDVIRELESEVAGKIANRGPA
jgi:hypothetical protein